MVARVSTVGAGVFEGRWVAVGVDDEVAVGVGVLVASGVSEGVGVCDGV